MALFFPQGTHQLGLGHAMCGGTDQRGPLCAIDASEQGHLQQEVIQNASTYIGIYSVYIYKYIALYYTHIRYIYIYGDDIVMICVRLIVRQVLFAYWLFDTFAIDPMNSWLDE